MSSIISPSAVSSLATTDSLGVPSTASGETKIIGQRLKDRIITKLSIWDCKLDTILPNFFFQNKLDEIGRFIQQKFEPLKKFNQWLDSNGHGAWYQKLATFLVKLPMRSVRNIVQLLYGQLLIKLREVFWAAACGMHLFVRH